MSPFDLKDYEPVEDRIRAFWSEHADGRIVTELIENVDGSYIVKAKVFLDNGYHPVATGLAHDSVDQLPANMKTSALEVCETSAIGRALANYGYAAKGKRPSREEMAQSSPGVGARPAESPPEGAPGDLSPGTSESGSVVGVPGDTGGGVADENGEGSDATSPLVSFEGVAKAAGSRSAAIALLNELNTGEPYTARTVLSAPESELHAAMETLAQRQAETERTA